MARAGARLGQHFLASQWPAKKLAEAVRPREGETIVEIGPGKGALTRELLHAGAPVVAIEKDEALVAHLRDTFADELHAGSLTLVEGDVRDFDAKASGLSAYVVAANIPYYITGEILRLFLTAPAQPRAMALLVQKEVAQRVISQTESVLSLSVKVFGRPSIVATVSKGNFNPPPSVDSAILLIDDISRDFFRSIDEERFFAVVRAGFSSKRKKLINNLAMFGKEGVRGAFAAIGLSENTRAEEVHAPMWARLYSHL